MFEEHVGKTVARFVEQRFFGRDTYKDEVRWTAMTIHFTDDTALTLGDLETEVYSMLTMDGVCTYCERALHREDDGTLIDLHESDECNAAVNGTGAHALEEDDMESVTDEAQLPTWTFFGHWDSDEIVVEYILPGRQDDEREDTGFWEQGLFAAAASGATQDEAEAAMRAEYEHTNEENA